MKKKYIGRVVFTDGNGKEEIVWQGRFFTLFFAKMITKAKHIFISTFDFDFCRIVNSRIEKIGD